MTRTHLKSLVLLNWKGIFYHRFELHERVTALEGQNGAGKTTVMIAAYVALLPDLSKLRFTNVGEHGATGGDRGIYGRLGEAGRPTYTVLEVGLADGTRLLCGVQLQRKSAPSLELNPFIITGLTDSVALADVLLERADVDGIPLDAITEMDGIRQNAARLGGRLEAFGSAKDYFAKLFDYGVTPMRLVNEDERDKFNEVLRTSMVGGISRALGGELRSFLLKEETGLADSLKQMRSNLDACRKTRGEVTEAQKIESRIQSVMEAGLEMFAAAIHAGRTRVAELYKAWEDSRLNYDQSEQRFRELQADVSRLSDAHQQVEQEYEKGQTQKQVLTTEIERLTKRCELDRKISAQHVALASHAADAETARQQHQIATAEHDLCVQRKQKAEDAVVRAADGLADLGKGLEELRYRATSYRQATEAYERVKQAHAPTPVYQDQFSDLQRACLERIGELDRELVTIQRQRGGAARHAKEYETAAHALSVLCSAFLSQESAVHAATNRHQQAQLLLSKLRDLVAKCKALPRLHDSWTTAKKLASEQQEVLSAASALATAERPLTSSAEVFEFKEQVDTQQQNHTRLLAEVAAELSACTQKLADTRKRKSELAEELRQYLDVQAEARQLAEEWTRPLPNSTAVDSLRVELGERLTVLQRDADGIAQRQKQTAEALWRMEQSGCLPETLQAACQRVEGELLAERFEDVSVEDAASVQAKLGPLCEAIVVDDIDAAVSVLTKLESKHRPDTVWLIERETDLQGLVAASPQANQGHDVLVNERLGHRLTKIPSHPVLGARARRQRAGELRSQEHRLSEQLAQLRIQGDELKLGVEQCLGLLKRSVILDQSDPSIELQQVESQAAEAEEWLPGLTHRKSEQEEALRKLSKTADRLSALCRGAHLLDIPNQSQEAARLHGQIQQVQQLESTLQLHVKERELLEQELDVLRTEPLSAVALQQLEAKELQHAEARDGQQRLQTDLHLLCTNSAALGWSSAVETLKQKTVENESLRAQYEQAKRERDVAQGQAKVADARCQNASELASKATALVTSVEKFLHSLDQALEEVGGREQTPMDAQLSLEQQQSQLQGLLQQLPALEKRRTSLRDEVVTMVERARTQELLLSELREKVGMAERAAKPEQERCERIEKRAEESGVLHAALVDRYKSKFSAQGQVNLWTICREQRGVLQERLKSFQGDLDIARIFDDISTEQRSGESALDIWLQVRNFLLRCMPAQIAEANDPEVALRRLGEHLRRLGLRLSQQEDRLRGESQDIAHNIDGLVRKARKQIGRLNQDLAMVRFGSIVGVRIKVIPVERMESVLRALKDGDVQTRLFHSEMPLEEALQEIFRSYGGGHAGGHKLLDYREYLELLVEIRRQVGTDWEPVNATKMSTGEAIGVGAAVMMVVLRAWERDANLLRSKRSAGTLRLLFLDEANRLSRDSLDVLFDLCEGLELQLIIAAPEVAKAEGNITHHLVRTVEQGREEVQVSGRLMTPRQDDGAAVHVA